jgi:hypothetical protein
LSKLTLKKEAPSTSAIQHGPVPDVTNVLEEAISRDAKADGVKKIDPSREIMKLKDEGR